MSITFEFLVSFIFSLNVTPKICTFASFNFIFFSNSFSFAFSTTKLLILSLTSLAAISIFDSYPNSLDFSIK